MKERPTWILNFNPTLVRLRQLGGRLDAALIYDFNPTLVRLRRKAIWANDLSLG